MRLIALFSLKPGVDRAEYEAWARSRDLPDVRSLPSVRYFEVLRATGVLFSEDRPPYDYIEVLDVADLPAFLGDCAGEKVGRLAQEMGTFTDDATFITTEAL